MHSLLRFSAVILLGIYRLIGSPQFGGCCRFTPSCSEFALTCFRNFNVLTATKLTFKRLLSCRPGGRCGYDPVPIGGEFNGSK